MKEKEEDEERNENICPQTDTQVNTQRIQKLRSTLILCGSSGERANRSVTHGLVMRENLCTTEMDRMEDCSLEAKSE